MRQVAKAVIYITHGGRLLVFRHIGAPEAGIQVPAGTLEPGETPLEGARREAYEETGLENLRFVAALGRREFDARPYNRPEIHHRHFFHFECPGEPPATWQHVEISPSEGSVFPVFEFTWAPMPAEVPELIAGFGDCLPQLYQSLNIKDAA